MRLLNRVSTSPIDFLINSFCFSIAKVTKKNCAALIMNEDLWLMRAPKSTMLRSIFHRPSEKSINKTNIYKNITYIYINKTIICTNITFIYTFQRSGTDFRPLKL